MSTRIDKPIRDGGALTVLSDTAFELLPTTFPVPQRCGTDWCAKTPYGRPIKAATYRGLAGVQLGEIMSHNMRVTGRGAKRLWGFTKRTLI